MSTYKKIAAYAFLVALIIITLILSALIIQHGKNNKDKNTKADNKTEAAIDTNGELDGRIDGKTDEEEISLDDYEEVGHSQDNASSDKLIISNEEQDPTPEEYKLNKENFGLLMGDFITGATYDGLIACMSDSILDNYENIRKDFKELYGVRDYQVEADWENKIVDIKATNQIYRFLVIIDDEGKFYNVLFIGNQ